MDAGQRGSGAAQRSGYRLPLSSLLPLASSLTFSLQPGACSLQPVFPEGE